MASPGRWRRRRWFARGLFGGFLGGDELKQPWLKFYPADWRADPALRMCSLAARGLWMDMLCIMHDAEPYGSLIVNGGLLNAKQLAMLCGGSAREIEALLGELEAAGVFSREDNGTIYSRRMRRDYEKAERDKANGRGGGNPRLKGGVNPPDNPEVNGEDKAQKLEAEARSRKDISIPSVSQVAAQPKAAEKVFDEFWREYPKRDGANPKTPAAQKFAAALKSGIAAAEIMAATAAYRAECDARNLTGTPLVAQAKTWLGQRRWVDYAPQAPPPAEPEPTAEVLEQRRKMIEEGARILNGRTSEGIVGGRSGEPVQPENAQLVLDSCRLRPFPQ